MPYKLSLVTRQNMMLTKYCLCTLISIGVALTTHAKQDDQTGKNPNEKPDKGAAIYSVNKRDKAHKEEKGKKDKKYNERKEYREHKVPVCERLPDATGKPFSVPDAGSTAAFLGLSLAVIGLARRKWAFSLTQRS
jgi:hypothetical protein